MASDEATTPEKPSVPPRRESGESLAGGVTDAAGAAGEESGAGVQPGETPEGFSDAVAQPPVSILWHSNAPWVGTGYGAQTALFGPRVAEQLGYRLAFSAFYGLKGNRLAWASKTGHQYVVYPGGWKHAYGNDVIGAHSKHWFGASGKGVVILLTDPWVLDARICSKLPMLAWVPVDHDPLMPLTHNWLAKSGAIPVAMSRFGEEKLLDAGYVDTKYVPHGFDPAVFHQLDRKVARQAMGISTDRFVVGMVAANKGKPGRKSFSQAIAAFAAFKEIYPDSLLYLHTPLEDGDGENIPAMCDQAGVRPMFTDQYGLALGFPASGVSVLMNAFDVLLNPAMGEGFGVPLIEAQACGTPCITTNFSAMPEVAPVDAGNWSVGGQKVFTGFDSYQVTPDIEEIVVSLTKAHDESEKDRLKRRASVAAHASAYEADKITQEFWKPVLEQSLEELSWRSARMVTYST